MKKRKARYLAMAILSAAFVTCVRRAEIVGTTASPSPSVPQDNIVKRKALYFPNSKRYGELPEGFRELEVTTADGLRLNAWFLAPPEQGFLLLYFHGNGGNLSSLGPQFEALAQAGAGVLAIDYRGYGKSQGVPDEAGFYLDSEAVYALAVEMGYSADRIVIYGRSLGGGVATYLASRKPAAGLVLESTFTSVQEVARRTHGQKAALLVSGFNNLERLPDIESPTLIMHGTLDTTIPADMASELSNASPNAALWMVEGADHNTLRRVAGAEYAIRITEFLEGLRNRKSQG